MSTRYAVALTYAATPGIEDPLGETEWIRGFEPKPERSIILAPWFDDVADAQRVAASLRDDPPVSEITEVLVVQDLNDSTTATAQRSSAVTQ